MLLEVKIKNFFSFAEEQVFSMIPNNDLKKHKDVLLRDKKKPLALPVVAIYGANASGKSNFVRIFNFLFTLLTIEPSAGILNSQYFLYDKKYKDKPTEITISYYISGYVYAYLVKVKGQYIVSELLTREDSSENKTIIFSRNGNIQDGQGYIYDYDFIEDLKKEDRYIEVLKKLTLPEKTMFSTLVNNNNDNTDYIRDIKDFYIKLISGYFNNAISLAKYSISFDRFEKDEKFMNKVNKLIQAIDVNISSVKVKKEAVRNPNIGFSNTQSYIPRFVFLNGEVELRPELMQVSIGTQVAFNMFLVIIQVLENGYLLVIDELENSLHPHVVELIIQIFYNKKINKNNAQLIFTTHDTSLLNQGLFRKDQIYFVEKDYKQASKIFSIDDINNTDKDNFASEYLTGRYGAIPNIKDIEDIFDE
ncbi:MAG: ATP-binding protein [Alphaproteobacteria bacterium]|jgi:AAA15 family ATPase/GTPase|nr:ATP-binding protein [Alphaproteobacteria bacterium]